VQVFYIIFAVFISLMKLVCLLKYDSLPELCIYYAYMLKKNIFNIAAAAILNLQNFYFLSNPHPRNGNFHLHTVFDRNWVIHGWDMKIKLFSQWRPSAILNLRKLPFWLCDLYLRVILHLQSKFRINWPIWPPRFARWPPWQSRLKFVTVFYVIL